VQRTHNLYHDTSAHASRTKRCVDTCVGSCVFPRVEESLFEAIIPFVRPAQKEVASGCSKACRPAAPRSLQQLWARASGRAAGRDEQASRHAPSAAWMSGELSSAVARPLIRCCRIDERTLSAQQPTGRFILSFTRTLQPYRIQALTVRYVGMNGS
jgi:hypothetical protein